VSHLTEFILWNRSIEFPREDMLETVVMEFQNCWIEARTSLSHDILSEYPSEIPSEMSRLGSTSIGSVTFDDIPFRISQLRCVILGMEKRYDKHDQGWSNGKRCHILFVKPKYARESCREYERAGIGFLDGTYISVKGVEGRIV